MKIAVTSWGGGGGELNRGKKIEKWTIFRFQLFKEEIKDNLETSYFSFFVPKVPLVKKNIFSNQTL